ncbi:38951_t:CDS:2 [Gigaspora margarita]|uniref:38951_t:CDS:1 n=1 Tax=Gigaspora margarita TaxID=4874 RepID=A0ABN7UUR9_GIGMA|nr:38951_t:CDS:2 [Gigaspora margarita]
MFNKLEKSCPSMAYNIIKENYKDTWVSYNEDTDIMNSITNSIFDEHEHIKNAQEYEQEIEDIKKNTKYEKEIKDLKEKEHEVKSQAPVHLVPELSVKIQEMIKEYFSNKISDEISIEPSIETFNEMSIKPSIDYLVTLIQNITKNTTLYDFAKMRDIYDSLNPRYSDAKKKLDNILYKDSKVLIGLFGKARTLREKFGNEFAKYISIPVSTLHNANIDALIKFIQYFKVDN